MTRKTILIVGCGGIGCHIAPALSLIHNLVLMDGDNYEPKNFGRQFPALTSKQNKAKTLSGMLQGGGRNVSHIADYFRPEQAKNNGYDLVISAVDNNLARLDLHNWCRNHGIPLILAGNAEQFGEAFLGGSEFEPMRFYDFPTEKAHNPARCNSDAVLDDEPQTVGANFMAASCVMQIMQSLYHNRIPHNRIAHSRQDLHGSEVKSIKKILKEHGEYEEDVNPPSDEPGQDQPTAERAHHEPVGA